MIGVIAGWRMAFTATVAFACLTLLAHIQLLPPLPASEALRPRDLVALLEVLAARVGLAAIALITAGHFAVYTYLKPFLQQVSTMDQGMITAVLLVYGIAGFIGTCVGERAAARSVLCAYIGTALLLAAAMLLEILLGGDRATAIALVAVWGFAFGAVPVCAQIRMFQAAPDRFEGGSALFFSTFEVALALGSFSGGGIVDRLGVSGALVLGGILSLAAAITLHGYGRSPKPSRSNGWGSQP